MDCSSQIPTPLQDAKFSHLRCTATNAQQPSPSLGESNNSNLPQQIAQATSIEDARQVVSKAITAKVAKMLVLPVEEVSAARSIASYGVDSLVAVKLRNLFMAQLEANVTIMDILGVQPMVVLAADIMKMSELVRDNLPNKPLVSSLKLHLIFC